METSENTLREFPLVIATVAKVSRKRGLWLIVHQFITFCQKSNLSASIPISSIRRYLAASNAIPSIPFNERRGCRPAKIFADATAPVT